MAQVWIWPHCTFPGCECRRTWHALAQVTSANLRHPTWVQGDRAVCYCHGLEAGATFPCDKTEKLTHSV